MTRAKRGWLAGIAVFFVLIAAGVYLFEWNMLRGPIAKRVEHATGRTLRDQRRPQRAACRARRGSPSKGSCSATRAWAKEPQHGGNRPRSISRSMPLALWRGRVVLPELSLSEARVVAREERAGRGELGVRRARKTTSRAPPEIGALALDRAHIDYRDPAIKTDFATDISTVAAGQKDAGMLKVTGRGRVKGLQGTIDGVVGSVLALASAEQPYPIRMRAVVGATRARVERHAARSAAPQRRGPELRARRRGPRAALPDPRRAAAADAAVQALAGT